MSLYYGLCNMAIVNTMTDLAEIVIRRWIINVFSTYYLKQ